MAAFNAMSTLNILQHVNPQIPLDFHSSRHHCGFSKLSSPTTFPIKPSFASVLRKANNPLPPLDLSSYSIPVPQVKGRGYFDIHFATMEEMQRIWASSSCNLDPGILRLSPWIPDFNPEDQTNTHTQIWARIYRLSQEYWHHKQLTSIARGVGIPLRIDDATTLRKFGYYARVLVDVDLSNPLPKVLWVERKDHGFNAELFYENLPHFCTCCKSIGHSSY
ncbi:hypothetical protein L1049_016795 [Liquidambar formosana]|uniref:DUF4283 domain-containing protein n=1 Tax=Liquidambar formosana TaxID=63359 RepID=A0AAP0S0G8_LIQFO